MDVIKILGLFRVKGDTRAENSPIWNIAHFLMTANLSSAIRSELHEFLKGKISKDQFKNHLQQVEQTQKGANWFTIFLTIDGILKNPSEEDRLKLLEVYIEAFPEGDWEERYGSDIVEQALE